MPTESVTTAGSEANLAKIIELLQAGQTKKMSAKEIADFTGLQTTRVLELLKDNPLFSVSKGGRGANAYSLNPNLARPARIEGAEPRPLSEEQYAVIEKRLERELPKRQKKGKIDFNLIVAGAVVSGAWRNEEQLKEYFRFMYARAGPQYAEHNTELAFQKIQEMGGIEAIANEVEPRNAEKFLQGTPYEPKAGDGLGMLDDDEEKERLPAKSRVTCSDIAALAVKQGVSEDGLRDFAKSTYLRRGMRNPRQAAYHFISFLKKAGSLAKLAEGGKPENALALLKQEDSGESLLPDDGGQATSPEDLERLLKEASGGALGNVDARRILEESSSQEPELDEPLPDRDSFVPDNAFGQSNLSGEPAAVKHLIAAVTNSRTMSRYGGIYKDIATLAMQRKVSEKDLQEFAAEIYAGLGSRIPDHNASVFKWRAMKEGLANLAEGGRPEQLLARLEQAIPPEVPDVSEMPFYSRGYAGLHSDIAALVVRQGISEDGLREFVAGIYEKLGVRKPHRTAGKFVSSVKDRLNLLAADGNPERLLHHIEAAKAPEAKDYKGSADGSEMETGTKRITKTSLAAAALQAQIGKDENAIREFAKQIYRATGTSKAYITIAAGQFVKAVREAGGLELLAKDLPEGKDGTSRVDYVLQLYVPAGQQPASAPATPATALDKLTAQQEGLSLEKRTDAAEEPVEREPAGREPTGVMELYKTVQEGVYGLPLKKAYLLPLAQALAQVQRMRADALKRRARLLEENAESLEKAAGNSKAIANEQREPAEQR